MRTFVSKDLGGEPTFRGLVEFLGVAHEGAPKVLIALAFGWQLHLTNGELLREDRLSMSTPGIATLLAATLCLPRPEQMAVRDQSPSLVDDSLVSLGDIAAACILDDDAPEGGRFPAQKTAKELDGLTSSFIVTRCSEESATSLPQIAPRLGCLDTGPHNKIVEATRNQA